MKPERSISNVLRWFFSIYIKGSLHVALAVTCFSLVTAFEYGLQVSPALLAFTFGSTAIAYNFTKYLSLLDRPHLAINPTLISVAIITLLSLVCTIIAVFQLSGITIGLAAIPALLTGAYALPLFRSGTNLRHVYGIKLFIIGIVWALVTVGLPFAAHSGSQPALSTIFIEGFQRLLFVMVLTLPFDIRDIQTDAEQLGTIPQIFGIQTTRTIGLTALAVAVLIETVQTYSFQPGFVVFLLMSGITAFLIHKSMAVRSPWFASFWVEGVPVLWAFLLFLLV
jgi:hypothetical protein